MIIDIYYDYAPSSYTLRTTYGTKNVEIYAGNTKTIKQTAQTIIHEITHVHYGARLNSIKEEFLCFIRSELHQNPNLTWEEMKNLLKKIKDLYPELEWRYK